MNCNSVSPAHVSWGTSHARATGLRLVGALLLLAAVGACTKETPEPIRVRETDVIIENRTQASWSGVEVWVNDHFRGLAPSVAAGQQLIVPLDGLVAAFGQRFDRHRQAVFGVLVTAKSSDGRDVRMTWGKVNRR